LRQEQAHLCIDSIARDVCGLRVLMGRRSEKNYIGQI